MRQRSVNEKAVGKYIAFLKDVYQAIQDGKKTDINGLQSKRYINKTTVSSMKKLGILSEDLQWDLGYQPDRKTAYKILESLRVRSDRQTDKPISDLWVVEIASIRNLLTEIRDNAKKKDKGLEGFKINERVYIAGQIANGYYTNGLQGDKMEVTNDFIIQATDDLLKKLNHGKE